MPFISVSQWLSRASPKGTTHREKISLPANHGHKFVDERLCLVRSKSLEPDDEVERHRGQSYDGEARGDGERPHEGLLHHEAEKVGAVVWSHLCKRLIGIYDCKQS